MFLSANISVSAAGSFAVRDGQPVFSQCLYINYNTEDAKIAQKITNICKFNVKNVKRGIAVGAAIPLVVHGKNARSVIYFCSVS